MRGIGALIIFLALAVFARAEDWTTADGRVYKDVVVVAAEDDGVRIKYDGGVGKIPYFELPDDLLKRFGKDAASLAAKKAADDKAAADAAMKAQQEAAELKKEQEEAAAAAATNAAPQSPLSAVLNPSSSTPGSTVPGKPGQPSKPGQPGQPGQPGANPNAANPAEATTSTLPPPPFNPTAPPTEDNPYPHSKFQYDEGIDTCYLDSYPVTLVPMVLDVSPTALPAQGQGGTLFFRITTEGSRAQAPDSVTGEFVAIAPLKKLAADHKVKFLVDGAFIQGEANPDENDVSPDTNTQATQVIFTLNPDQVKTLVNGKNVNVSFGSYDYRIDDAGLAILRGYQDDIDHLPPASTSLVRTYHHLVNRLPSIITMISTTCEYIILSAFGLVVVASIAAFIMGLTRFIKM